MTTKPELTPELKQEIIGWLMDSMQLEEETVCRAYTTVQVLKLTIDGFLIAEVTV